MKISFLWKNVLGVVSPHCVPETTNEDGINLLSCLLMDDGGVPYQQTIPWVQKGIKQVDSVLSGEVESSSWGRESWGVSITTREAKIYSLYDDEYFENIDTEQFRDALALWKTFLESKPRLEKSKDIVI
ncbi:hypothetical protein [Vreelandella sp. GE22]